MTHWGTLSLGELIELLEKREQEQHVRFDFGHFGPSTIHSYRGFYEHLAIGYEYAGKFETVADLVKALRACVGDTFVGYKGGTYRMDLDTPIWCDIHRDASSTAIVGICDCDYQTIIKTEWVAT